MAFQNFMLGASAMAAFVISAFLVLFWRATRDRFFAAFALAFTVFGVERIVLAVVADNYDARVYVYLVRLAAFLLIIAAVVDKNRAAAEPGG